MFQNDTSAKAQEMSDFQKAMGANMYEAYIDYFNALGLTVDGVSYELSEDGRSGSFYDFLLEQYGKKIWRFLQRLCRKEQSEA